MKPRGGNVVFYGLLVCVVAAAIALSVIPLQRNSPSANAVTSPPYATRTTSSGARPAAGTAPTRPAKQRSVPARPLTTISATRGPSWVVVRARSAVGQVLYRGVLEQGHRIRVRRALVWAQVGAVQNVDVRVRSRHIALGRAALTGVLLTTQGALPAQPGAPGIIGS
jgi:hypothetical protein